VGFLEKYLPSSYELSFTHRLLTLLEMAEEFQKCVARMATLPKSGLNGQNSPARGKASGRTPLALPRENIPLISSGFRRIRPPWRTDSPETKAMLGRLKVRRQAECRRCNLRRGVIKIAGKTQRRGKGLGANLMPQTDMRWLKYLIRCARHAGCAALFEPTHPARKCPLSTDSGSLRQEKDVAWD
jgi:hypothetical protein